MDNNKTTFNDSSIMNMYKKLFSMVVLNNFIVSIILVVSLITRGIPMLPISYDIFIFTFVFGIWLGASAVWSQYRCGLSYLQKLQDETKPIKIPLSNLAIFSTVIIDISLVGSIFSGSIIVWALILVNTYTLSVIITIHLMPLIVKKLSRYLYAGSVNRSDKMFYALRYGDKSSRYVLLGGMVFIFIQIYQTVSFPYLRLPTLDSLENFGKLILTILLSIMVGLILGYIQGIIRYRTIIKDTENLSEIQKASENHTASLSMLLSYRSTKMYHSYTIIMLSLGILWGISVIFLRAMNFIPLAGFVYGMTDFVLWRWYFRKRITGTPGYKSPLDI
jgi:hypothetical protein